MSYFVIKLVATGNELYEKLFLLCVFLIGLGFALFNFKGLAAQGEFESIVLDFRRYPIPDFRASKRDRTTVQRRTPANSEFSVQTMCILSRAIEIH